MPTSLTRRLTLIFGLRGSRAVNRAINGMQSRIGGLNNTLRVFRSLSLLAFLGFGALVGTATNQAIRYESAFAGVVKTVEDAADRTGKLTAIGRELRQSLLDLSVEIPVTAVELANIAEIAGQLGIRSKDIVGFTETIAKLSRTTNIIGEEGALQLAKFLNITQTSPELVENLGSAIVDLGNNFATQEAQILHIATNLAVLSSAVGISAQEVLALSTVISASGGQAEAAATVFQTLGIEMQNAVQSGGEKLESFARIAGVSADIFASAFRENAFDGIRLFLEGLARSVKAGDNLKTSLSEVGLASRRSIREIGKVVANIDQLSQAQDRANKAFTEGSALQIEFDIRAQTTASQMIIFGNVVRAIGVEVGSIFLPTFIKVFSAIRNIITTNREQIVEFAKGIETGVRALIGGSVAVASFVKENKDLVVQIGLIIAGVTALSLLLAVATNPFVLLGVSAVGLAVIINKLEGDIRKDLNNIIIDFRIFILDIQKRLKIELEALKSFGFVSAETANKIREAYEFSANKIRNTDFIGAGRAALSGLTQTVEDELEKLKQKVAEFANNPLPNSQPVRKDSSPAALAANRIRLISETLLPTQPDTEIADRVLPPTVLDRFQQGIELARGFRETIRETGAAMKAVYGDLGRRVFIGLAKTALNTLGSISEASRAFFADEREQFFSFKSLGKLVWAELRASALDSIADIISKRAKQWAFEAAAAALSGNFARAAGLAALATAAGAGAAVIQGAAAGIRDKARKDFESGDSFSGGSLDSGEDGGGGGVTDTARSGSIAQRQDQIINIQPTIQFINEGGVIAIGAGSLEEAGETLADIIIKVAKDAQEGGELV